MGEFPSKRHQFRGGERAGKHRPLVGARRARKLKRALAEVEAVHGTPPAFEGDSVDFLRAVMRGEIAPNPTQMAAAIALTKFERPQLSAVASVGAQNGAGIVVISGVPRCPNDPVALSGATGESWGGKDAITIRADPS